jgi:enamine deaminase RidA (YjgF/YER057c/UK114 family)
MLASIAPNSSSLSSFRIAFAGGPVDAHASALVATPWLAGAPHEDIFPGARPAGTEHGVELHRAGALLLGHARESVNPAQLDAQTDSLYRRVLTAARGRHLCRIWNYVPQINALTAGFENYRAFCRGRSLAFEATFGSTFQPQLPAASAVGCVGSTLDVFFVASDASPTHFENPEQVPAYLYPPEHGPRAPSFARATVVRDGARTWSFISGTSAIKGHETVAPGALDAQIDCTLDNLRLISRQAGLGDNLGAGRGAQRHFKIYLRHAGDLGATRTRLEQALLQAGDLVTYLQSDICRAALNIEIEATLVS